MVQSFESKDYGFNGVKSATFLQEMAIAFINLWVIIGLAVSPHFNLLIEVAQSFVSRWWMGMQAAGTYCQ